MCILSLAKRQGCNFAGGMEPCAADQQERIHGALMELTGDYQSLFDLADKPELIAAVSIENEIKAIIDTLAVVRPPEGTNSSGITGDGWATTRNGLRVGRLGGWVFEGGRVVASATIMGDSA